MITPRTLLLAGATALLGCAASSTPTTTAEVPPAPIAPPNASAAPTVVAGGGAIKVDAEPVPGQLPSEVDPASGSGPDQATIVAETKRLRNRARACITVPGALRTGRVTVVIGPNGRADSVVVTGHLEGTTEGGCVATAFRDLHVAPFAGAPVTVKMSVSLP
jgi:hypothetical protein